MPIEEKAIELQNKLERKVGGIGRGKYARILRMAKKPKGDEFTKVLMITGAGIILLGLLGFVIYYLMEVVFAIP